VTMDTLLVGVGRYDSDHDVVAAAAVLARRSGATIRLIHVAPAGEHDEAERSLASMASGLDVPTEVRVVEGSPGPAIVENAAAPGTTIVVGDPGRSALGDLIAGSVTEAVLARSDQPVFVVGPHAAAMSSAPFGPVVICFDEQVDSESIIDPASEIARVLGAAVVLVEVVAPEERVLIDGVYPVDSTTAAGRQRLGEIADRLRAGGVSELRTQVLYGADVSRAVAHFAGEQAASIVALATHGRAGVRRLLRGSTTHHLVAVAPCPVLTVHCS
jgi:nucleotide-binding universal stress UspA family protein